MLPQAASRLTRRVPKTFERHPLPILEVTMKLDWSAKAEGLGASAKWRCRPPQAQRDAAFALNYVKQQAKTPEQQQAVLAALEFKCGVLWAMLDALYYAYVAPKQVPPGAFIPDEK